MISNGIKKYTAKTITYSVILLIFIGSIIFFSMKDAFVCASPPMPKCPPGFGCISALPSDQTYKNILFMYFAGAKYLHSGVCKE